jgi:hypothetical protein
MKQYTDINELRQLAKNAGVVGWKTKSRRVLLKELEQVQAKDPAKDIILEHHNQQEPPLLPPRVQMRRGTARIGIMRRDLAEYQLDGWVIDE